MPNPDLLPIYTLISQTMDGVLTFSVKGEPYYLRRTASEVLAMPDIVQNLAVADLKCIRAIAAAVCVADEMHVS